ncbi:putative pentatricopeptide repeat-containing protein At3g25060, mitochondrial [Mercurialis annua]|uniref:putative pentatricopeptide repeat-containing protein At3g25060, mitochondrial n=1 Tax=Mercurialis annua TaxID=3986 RepID=UPI00215FC948|nr:putative pentatricopeptide repeat-containing protein At3g25060, mitochondrial [Mercurialis annua]
MLIPWLSHFKPLILACKHKTTITQLHALILTTGLSFNDPNSITPLIASYARINSIVSARKVFDKMPQRTVNAWNSMIIAYSRTNYPNEVFVLYHRMVSEGSKPDSSIFTVTIKACSSLMELEMGEKIWSQAVDFGYGCDVFVGSSILNLYVKCGRLDKAKMVFDKMVKKDVVSWTTMITGFAQSGMAVDAIDVYRKMQNECIEVDGVVMVGLIQACGGVGDSKLGLSVHGYMVRKEMIMHNVLQTSLVYMYAKNGRLELALRVFEDIRNKSVVSWGALVSGFAQNGFTEKALALLIEMQSFGFKPDSVTLISSLSACSQAGYLKLGKSLHGYMVRRLHFEQVLGTALIDMYAKCGSLSSARALFDQIESRDLLMWNAMIAGYGIHGDGREALLLFLKMRETYKNPDHATFASLFSALSHSGLVEEAQHWFRVMVNVNKIQPGEKHYACMVDLLSRAGRVEEAYWLIKSMHTEPGLPIWVALLSGCLNYRKLLIGEMAAKKILESNPDDLGIYVLVSNFFSMAKKWEEAAVLRKIMKNTGMRKVPGYSAVEVNGNQQAFLMEDKNHEKYQDILQILVTLNNQMKSIRCITENELVI